MPEDLERRIARLEAVREIEQLKIRYAKICDAGYDPAEIAKIVTDDVVWDGGAGLGRHEGKQAVCDFFAGAPNRITWALHYMIAPAVEVDNLPVTPNAVWRLLESAGAYSARAPAIRS